ncbi:MAG: NAD(P)/FAD-dependent oxidoreductase [Acidimicrobiia bacterium]
MKTDVAIIGAGPAGATAAIDLARMGIDTVLVEKETFPRFHIGESLTGESGKVLRSLGLEERLNEKGHPVKRGVKVFGPGGRNSFWVPVVTVTEEGDRFESSTWQVRRSDFDTLLLEEAQSAGATLLKGEALEPIVQDDGQVTGLRVALEDGIAETIESKILLDASGMKCFLSRAKVTGPKERGLYDKQIAVFTHVRGAKRDPGDQRDNTIIFYQKPAHWAWFIPIDDETVSVGVVVPTSYFRDCDETKTEFLTREFRELNSELAERLVDAEIGIEPLATTNYSYHIREFTGPGWACIGDSHRFIDPVFSFGVHFSLHEARKVATAIAEHLAAGAPDGVNPFREYQSYAEAGQDVIQDMLDAFWLEPFGFAYAVHKAHRDEIIDFFAGRFYDLEDEPDGLAAIRKLAASGRARQMAQAGSNT